MAPTADAAILVGMVLAVLAVVGPIEHAQAAPLFLGEDLIAYLVLAFGGAMFVGNVAALARPRRHGPEGSPRQASLRRSVPMALVGLLASIWALATLMASN